MSDTYPIGTAAESERLVRSWGFRHVFTWEDGRYFPPMARRYPSNSHYSPHSHGGLTTHLIRRGSLTITYPEDNVNLHGGQVLKETFGVGARIDVPAGKLHEVWIGNEGCEYVIGE
ncbi:hypothetical protein N7510_000603 [Penicillium lagena]|uniref:uncharacterized protein n=1 Tax=Penicillium lagena TaxID=94218 RepID=UPI00254015C4|nr:uncharacterized protein N7510_000603 [Penicillium lagena]KAJ5624294.1 hypothetical protein N7510_000603 [Penicillium lagena]